MKVKVCGMKDGDNVADVVTLGPDFVGFIFHPASPRFVDDDQVVIPTLAPAGVQRVGVFVNPSLEEVMDRIARFHLDFAQLHGDESPGFCAAVQGFLPVIKAFRLHDDFDFATATPYEAVSDYFVFDARGKNYGGNGHKFNWEVLEQYQGSTPFLLSGGIGPDDAGAIGTFSHPQFVGVDLNSGFETSPGQKDVARLRTFFQAIQSQNTIQP